MTVSETLARVDTLCPNTRSTAEKLAWLSSLDGQVAIFLGGYEEDDFRLGGNPHLPASSTASGPTSKMCLPTTGEGLGNGIGRSLPYREGDMNAELLVPFPFDELYVHYLHAQIMYAMGEFSKYENALVQFNSLMQAYRIDYHQTHMPRRVRKRVL